MVWGQLDYLVVDTPPGTSDEHMAALDALRPYSPLGAVVVTTPQVLKSIVPFSVRHLTQAGPSPCSLCLSWLTVQGSHGPVPALPWLLGGVRGGRAAGTDIL